MLCWKKCFRKELVMRNLDKEIQPTYDKCSICIMMTQLLGLPKARNCRLRFEDKLRNTPCDWFCFAFWQSIECMVQISLDQSQIELKQYILIWHYNQLKIPLSTEMIEDFVDKFGCTYNYSILWYFCVMDFKFTLALSLAPSVFLKKYNLSISGIRLYIVIEYVPGIHPMRDLPD